MEPLYIGIDVHKRTYSYTVIKDGVVIKKGTEPAQPTRFAPLLRRWFPNINIKSVYEAGCCGFTLHRVLIANGIDNFVVNPSSIVKAANDKVKTDSIDSKKLALYLSKSLLKPIYVPTREEQAKRSLLRLRQQLVEQRTQVSNQIKSFLLYHGLSKFDDRKKVNDKFICNLERIPMSAELKKCVKIYASNWRQLTVQIYEISKELQKQSEEQADVDRILRSVPGIGLVTARTLATELGDLVKRFPNQKGLFSYLGLTPSEYSSGGAIHRGHITHSGPARIRRLLTEVSWITIGKDEALASSYKRIAARRGKNIAIIAIARKLIGRIRACFKQNTTYVTGLYQ